MEFFQKFINGKTDYKSEKENILAEYIFPSGTRVKILHKEGYNWNFEVKVLLIVQKSGKKVRLSRTFSGYLTNPTSPCFEIVTPKKLAEHLMFGYFGQKTEETFWQNVNEDRAKILLPKVRERMRKNLLNPSVYVGGGNQYCQLIKKEVMKSAQIVLSNLKDSRYKNLFAGDSFAYWDSTKEPYFITNML